MQRCRNEVQRVTAKEENTNEETEGRKSGQKRRKSIYRGKTY